MEELLYRPALTPGDAWKDLNCIPVPVQESESEGNTVLVGIRSKTRLIKLQILYLTNTMEKTVLFASTSALSASLLTILAYRCLSKKSEDKENKYESEKLLGEYLELHYGKPDKQLPFGFGPKEALDFPVRCALECIKHTEVSYCKKICYL